MFFLQHKIPMCVSMYKKSNFAILFNTHVDIDIFIMVLKQVK